MTGFGRGELYTEEQKIVVEMKAVNHRYSDITVKLPRKLNSLENAIRSYLKEHIVRGKVDVFITYEDIAKSDVGVVYNKALAEQYVMHLKEMAEEFSLSQSITPVEIARFPEVFTLEDQKSDEDTIWANIEKVLEDATKMFVQARITEGENLKNDLISKLDNMLAMVATIEEMSPQIIAEYKAKLTDRIAEMLENTQIDEQRIAMEVTIFADKVCVDEEIVRLKSHIDGAKNILTEGGAVGRKLDFIVQEMNREANTILSKSTSLQVSDIGINLKTEIEKVREQIQNIE